MLKFPLYEYQTLIRERHLDSFGHVNNATYLEIAEEARWEMLSTTGYDFNFVHTARKGPTILDIKIEFKRELKLRDLLTVESFLVEYKRKVGTMQQDFYIADSASSSSILASTLTLTLGLFDMEKRRLISPTPEWAKALSLPSE
jgi:thioesterase-3